MDNKEARFVVVGRLSPFKDDNYLADALDSFFHLVQCDRMNANGGGSHASILHLMASSMLFSPSDSAT